MSALYNTINIIQSTKITCKHTTIYTNNNIQNTKMRNTKNKIHDTKYIYKY